MSANDKKRQTVDVVEHLPGEERGIPSVNDIRPSRAKRTLIFAGMLLVVSAFVGLGYWKYQRKEAQQHAAEAKKDLQLTSAVPPRTFADPPATEKRTPPPLPGTDIGTATPIAVVPAPAGTTTPPGTPSAASGATTAGPPAFAHQRMVDKAESSLMVAGETQAGLTKHRSTIPAMPGNADKQQAGGLATLLTSTSTPPRSASMLGNRNLLLAKGSFIDCALQTRLDSTVPGMTACVVTRDIYSDNGAMKLIEKGSTITGEYQANMRQGMARIYVLWNRIRTTRGVVIDLDSPATDALGGAGLPGEIDTHFWQRFGGAILLSLVSDVGSALASSAGGEERNQINFNGTAGATSQIVGESLRGTINIPPTLIKNQGEQVGVYVARDLDFSKVYDVAAE